MHPTNHASYIHYMYHLYGIVTSWCTVTVTTKTAKNTISASRKWSIIGPCMLDHTDHTDGTDQSFWPQYTRITSHIILTTNCHCSSQYKELAKICKTATSGHQNNADMAHICGVSSTFLRTYPTDPHQLVSVCRHHMPIIHTNRNCWIRASRFSIQSDQDFVIAHIERVRCNAQTYNRGDSQNMEFIRCPTFLS